MKNDNFLKSFKSDIIIQQNSQKIRFTLKKKSKVGV